MLTSLLHFSNLAQKILRLSPDRVAEYMKASEVLIMTQMIKCMIDFDKLDLAQKQIQQQIQHQSSFLSLEVMSKRRSKEFGLNFDEHQELATQLKRMSQMMEAVLLRLHELDQQASGPGRKLVSLIQNSQVYLMQLEVSISLQAYALLGMNSALEDQSLIR